jgi:two-component system chemotaxis sensor kinase CheA
MSSILHALRRSIVLPAQISAFERRYLQRMNRIAMAFFAIHVPAFMIVAYFNGTGSLLAATLTLAVMAGPAIAAKAFENPRSVSVVYGFTAMLMGGLLVHFGQGPVQIEMHFYFFALVAMLALFGNPMVIVVAAVTVALHHLALWLYLPASVFNYEAPVWVVAVHAAFVVLESVAAVFIARSFFDNVIGLEKIVDARTQELDARNKAMRLVLDNVEQGCLTLDREGRMSPEYSSALERWFGTPQPHARFVDYFEPKASGTAVAFECAWDQMLDGILPLDVALDQMPRATEIDGRSYELAYTPIMGGEELQQMLLVVTDVTAARDRERLQAEQQETATMLDRVVSDRAGFLEYYAEATDLVDAITHDGVEDLAALKRAVHTLKGNSMIFGVNTVADLCHEIECNIVGEHRRPSLAERTRLADRWGRLRKTLDGIFGDGQHQRIEVEAAQLRALLEACLRRESHGALTTMIADLCLEPTAARLARVGEQARRIAQRLGKGDIQVDIEDEMLRLEPKRWSAFWSAFVHVVRNAVDHGLETAEVREQTGKDPAGTLRLRTHLDGDDFVIELADDGRGIDWERVADRARVKGIDVSTPERLAEALFVDGVTTTDRVTEFSGRGVGLGAVRDATRSQGGDVLVHSKPGEGTRFEFRFPATAMAPEPKNLLAAA